MQLCKENNIRFITCSIISLLIISFDFLLDLSIFSTDIFLKNKCKSLINTEMISNFLKEYVLVEAKQLSNY